MKLIGDARDTWLDGIRIPQWEAQELANIEHRHNPLLDNKEPKIEYSGRVTTRRHGTCYPDGTIVLHVSGENLGTLAHELAHLNAEHEDGHGYYFKQAHLSILESFEDYARNRR